MNRERVLILTSMLHVNVGLEKLQGQPEEVYNSPWKEGETVSGAISLFSPFGELSKGRVVQKSIVRC